jgi:excisionase family DNA binding protein
MLTLTSADIAELETLAEEVRASRPHTSRLLRRVLKVAVRPSEETLLTTTEASRILGVSDQTVRNWADAGWLPSRRMHKLGRRMIPETSLRAVQAFDAVKLVPKKPLSEAEAGEIVRKHRRERARA